MNIVYLDSDYEYEYSITRRNADTGETEVADGLTGLSGRLSATDGGEAVDSSLDVAATERPEKPGTYYGILQGDDLRLFCAPVSDPPDAEADAAASLIGKTAYIVFGDGTNVLISEPVKIYGSRRPT